MDAAVKAAKKEGAAAGRKEAVRALTQLLDVPHRAVAGRTTHGLPQRPEDLLHAAVRDGTDLDLIQELIDIGTNINDGGYEDGGRSPLHWACFKGRLEIGAGDTQATEGAVRGLDRRRCGRWRRIAALARARARSAYGAEPTRRVGHCAPGLALCWRQENLGR